MATTPLKYFSMILLLMFLNGTLNILFYVTYKADVCQVDALINPTLATKRLLSMEDRIMQIQNPSSTTTTPSTTTTNSSTTTNTSNSSSSTTSNTVKKNISFSLVHLPMAIAVFYYFLFFLNVIQMIGLNNFTDQLSMQYQDIGIFKNILGILVKLIPSLIKLFHYVIFLLICGQWVAIFTESSCKTAQHIDFYNKLYVGLMWSESRIYNSFASFLWIVLNCFCPFVRKSVYFPNFVYKPLNRRVSWVRRCLFQELGP